MTLSQSKDCPLCKSVSNLFFILPERKYFKCNLCYSVFMDPEDHPNLNVEKERYLKHKNDVNDIGYRNFVSPIVQAIQNEKSIDAKGLDFGAGTGPVTAQILSDKGYSISLYDPFFWPQKELLNLKYDFIILCEVMEHFRNPHKEFELLRSLLNPDGKIYCMTSLFDDSINFQNWYYKNDLTHLFFYHSQAIHWIRDQFKLKSVQIKDKLIVFIV